MRSKITPGYAWDVVVHFIRSLYITLLLLLLIIVIGIWGFMYIEDYSLVEGFYMTIITISTVGFGEVKPLSEAGRIFTAFFIIATFGIFTYGISTLTAFFIEGNAKEIINTYRMLKKIKKLKNHVIICGFGRNGIAIVKELLAKNISVVVVEQNPDVEKYLQKYEQVYYVMGDATSDTTLKNANIEAAKTLITTLPQDADNVFIVLSARQLNPNLRIISRASSEGVIKKLKIAGANFVVQPEQIGGIQMAHLAVNPDILEFLEMLLSDPEQVGIHFAEFGYEKLKSDFQGKSIYELRIRERTGANVIGIKKADNRYIINPDPKTLIEPGDKLILIGNEEQINAFKKEILNLYS